MSPDLHWRVHIREGQDSPRGSQELLKRKGGEKDNEIQKFSQQSLLVSLSTQGALGRGSNFHWKPFSTYVKKCLLREENRGAGVLTLGLAPYPKHKAR